MREKADRIIAVDPGGTTGVVIICDGNTTWQQFGTAEEFVCWMDRELSRGQAVYRTYIVCESWQGRGGALTAQYDAQNIIGWLWGHTVTLPHRAELVMQSPGDRMWTTTGKLNAAGVNPPMDHAKQAAKHAIRFIMLRSDLHGLEIDRIRAAVTKFIEAL